MRRTCKDADKIIDGLKPNSICSRPRYLGYALILIKKLSNRITPILGALVLARLLINPVLYLGMLA